ncbi:bifunctional metallophosphatase/5'-nucleotidase [Rubrivivax gelatinosus]|uniref:5'-nucleotidase n=1 Tax=Rubrivivax gelatinosus TaxID=28068 RepID=A0A4R2MFK2_RUBGE|nr:5'-nucleotidase C-terminal domain-containing protein [Rubrivivax gelatinosus]MBK1688230.1 bifunctional metallophosphatase/5'-nucleotidase [Rubrivivax gelatinosus]TCP05500.1 5'-nucleotidase [Rubrivivax gelatinosus]
MSLNPRLRATFLRRAAVFGITSLAVAALTACGGDDDGEDSYPAIEINIAHVNDHHSQLEPFSAFEMTLGGEATQVELGGFSRLTTLFDAQAGTKNLLKLHAGDAVTGTLYYTFFKGEADAKMMNTVCFDAFELGNHEFDDGDQATRDFIDMLHAGSCQTPVLGANVVPASGTPLNPSGTPLVQPYTIKTYDGVKVGIVGIDIAGKTVNSSRPLSTTQFLDEVTTAQKYIDELKRQGIRHIVLLTHQGYDADKAMATQLSDVDVIIGGDSHTLLGDFSAFGVASSGAYPTQVTNKDGAKVCIGQAWEYAKVFALMNVKFDDKGAVASCSGNASLVIGDSFARKDGTGSFVAVDDATKASIVASLATEPRIKVTTPDADAAALLATYTTQVAAEKTKTIGTASQALCLVRIPGESTNRSSGIAGCIETGAEANLQARGSDAAQVVSEAFLAASKRAHFALQNAGGVRVPLQAGTLTMNDAFTLLPFTNVLVEIDVTGAQMVAALEDGVANHLDNGQSSGSHPYAAGLRWNLDMSQPKGSRFSQVQVKDRVTGTWSAIDPAKTYTLVTNDFVAAGQDGYATLGTVYATGAYVNTYLLYTQTFADYVKAQGTVARPARADYSHQQVTTAAGVVLP